MRKGGIHPASTLYFYHHRPPEEKISVLHASIIPENNHSFIQLGDISCGVGSTIGEEIDFAIHVKVGDDAVDSYLAMWYALFFIYQKSLSKKAVPLHAALIAKEGRGVVLIGAGGAGKSTCCARLPLEWQAICDDEVLVVHDGEGKYYAHPFPTWSNFLFNKEGTRRWDIQQSFLIKGLFFITQEEKDTILPLNKTESAVMLNHSAHQVYDKYLRSMGVIQNKIFNGMLLNNAIQLAGKIPSFVLGVSLKGRFWEKIGEMLNI